MPIAVATDLDYLIDGLRLHLGDTDSTAYRYLDEWLRTSLIEAFKELQRWWNYKYLLDTTTYVVTRNPNSSSFLFASPPVIQVADDRVIILMAAIIIKQGSLENSAWNVVSWKDYEISFSNLESGRLRDASIKRDWDELTMLLKPPTKRLAQSLKASLPGYLNNNYEYDDNNRKF